MAWHFHDLHGFKDYVVFVQTCATNERFPFREGFGSNEQWTLALAFEGLRFGLKLAAEEKGPMPVFATCEKLVDEAYAHYREGRTREGFFKLEEMQKLLKKIPTQ
jgi:hypothetical protein